MKHFLADTLYTLLLVFFLVLPMEWMMGRRQCEYHYKGQVLAEEAERIGVLIVGHSLFANSLDPHAVAGDAFCAATPDRHLCYDRLLLERYLPGMANVRAVLLPLHTEMPVAPTDVAEHRFSYARYLHLYPTGNLCSWSALLEGQLRRGCFEPTRIVGRVESKRDDNDPVIDSAGYSPLFTEWDGETKPFVPRLEVAEANREEYTECLLAIARTCERQGVRLVLVMPPHSDRCIALSDPDRRLLSMVYEAVETVQGACEGVEMLDYYEDAEFRSPSLYAEGYHLNYRGATLLGRRIKADAGL